MLPTTCLELRWKPGIRSWSHCPIKTEGQVPGSLADGNLTVLRFSVRLRQQPRPLSCKNHVLCPAGMLAKAVSKQIANVLLNLWCQGAIEPLG